jgi:hypothetical protein
VTVLTVSGVAGVSKSYDVARTLGARSPFLVWKVAVPAALPVADAGEAGDDSRNRPCGRYRERMLRSVRSPPLISGSSRPCGRIPST